MRKIIKHIARQSRVAGGAFNGARPARAETAPAITAKNGW
jgi:hypothetical protein